MVAEKKNKIDQDEEQIEKLMLGIKDAKSKISSLRKEGKDPFIASALLRNFEPKINWLKVENKKEDFEKAEEELKRIYQEIKEESERVVVNYKKDVEILAKQKISENPEIFEKTKAEKFLEEESISEEEKIKKEQELKTSKIKDSINKLKEEVYGKSSNSDIKKEVSDNVTEEISEKKPNNFELQKDSKQIVSGDNSESQLQEETRPGIKKDESSKLKNQNDEIKVIEEKNSYEVKEEKVSESDNSKIKKSLSELFSQRCPEDNYFSLNDGTQLQSLDDFINKIPFIKDEEFAFHTRPDQENFSKWIEHVFKLSDLAKKIKGITDKQKMIDILKASKRGE